ncbi:ubiquinol-cytochrome C chaperone family protein [Paraburkholderia heleia]|uniref:ubiquinol-cytochrome C chaperone family protein n=1 Tax=Paraburkholderia heleia TaxID=634127 RepID=UPI002AB65A65|nr:ubiquinol-cytochrome C chaperone family protein [Paraburkholderia heleia]
MSTNASLSDLLKAADVEDLDVLTDYLTDKGEGRLMLDGDVCKRLIRCKKNGEYDSSDRSLIAKEIRAFGGNTLVNLFRGGGVEYPELARDVAGHLKVPFSKTGPVVNVEMALLQKLFTDALDRMSPEERKKTLDELNIGDLAGMGPGAVAAAIAAGRLAGFAAYKMALIVANAIARAILGRGLPLVVNAALTRTMGVMLGPVGWVLTGVWTLADLASPAYRVTVPCVVQIAYMRQKAISATTTTTCPECHAINARSAKFCAECGTGLK